ncbi:hypothetical protein PV325_011834, partial [Microctonus aethiopoides]
DENFDSGENEKFPYNNGVSFDSKSTLKSNQPGISEKDECLAVVCMFGPKEDVPQRLAKELSKTHKFKYVIWVMDVIIWVRKDDDTEKIRVVTENDLQHIRATD